MLKPRKRASFQAGYFILTARDGRFWTGKKLRIARVMSIPLSGRYASYEQATHAAERVLRKTGCQTFVLYVPGHCNKRDGKMKKSESHMA